MLGTPESSAGPTAMSAIWQARQVRPWNVPRNLWAGRKWHVCSGASVTKAWAARTACMPGQRCMCTVVCLTTHTVRSWNAAVCSQLPELSQGRAWPVRPWTVPPHLRAVGKRHVRSGASAQTCLHWQPCGVPDQTCVSGMQCAKYCTSAGAGKCDPGRCTSGFGVTPTGTCALVGCSASWAALLAC